MARDADLHVNVPIFACFSVALPAQSLRAITNTKIYRRDILAAVPARSFRYECPAAGKARGRASPSCQRSARPADAHR
jgi:hypothetical protein